jgi:uncharacterized metal-binding protein
LNFGCHHWDLMFFVWVSLSLGSRFRIVAETFLSGPFLRIFLIYVITQGNIETREFGPGCLLLSTRQD